MAKQVGFLTDVSLCIGCKACEVACKEWNQLEGNPPEFRDSLDNTGQLDAENWRHVKFIEQDAPDNPMKPVVMHMMSDVCKHCQDAPCLNVCPTNAIVRTEFDTVYIKQDTCNGCRDCIAACPYSVIGFSKKTGTVHKCTFCYDRLQADLQPACATACPTQSIKFGDLAEMRKQGAARAAQLRAEGVTNAQVYGDNEYGGLHSIFVLLDKPEVYKLPTGKSAERLNSGTQGYWGLLVTAALGMFAGLIALRRNGVSGEKG